MSKAKSKILVVFGTRPEAIKLAPVIKELRAHPEAFEARVCVTAQHREMLDQVLEIFSIRPDFDLNLMEPGQTLAGYAARALTTLDALFRKERPDLVVVQGDTTTTFVASLAGFYNGAKVAHVEAGLRSFDRYAPFPEEINRALATRLTDLHFAPTESARRNLLREGIETNRIFVTGNTVVDALLDVARRLESGELRPLLAEQFPRLPARYVLVTAHRRENHGKRLRDVFLAVRELSGRLGEFEFIFPVHLNPEVQNPAREILGTIQRVHLIPPVDYLSFVWLMQHSALILTDSGGIQEEAPSLGKRVLVMREVTERPEATEAGVAKLVGCERDHIIAAVVEAIRDGQGSVAHRGNPFGDGCAAKRIVATISSSFEKPPASHKRTDTVHVNTR